MCECNGWLIVRSFCADSSVLSAGWSLLSRPDTFEAIQFPVLTSGTLNYTVRVRTPSTFHPTIAQVRGEVEQSVD